MDCAYNPSEQYTNTSDLPRPLLVQDPRASPSDVHCSNPKTQKGGSHFSDMLQSLGEASWGAHNGRMIFPSAPDVLHVTEEGTIPGHEGLQGYLESRSSVHEEEIETEIL